MSAVKKKPKLPRRGRPRKIAPMTLPDDLYDYVEDCTRHRRASRSSDNNRFGVPGLTVIDDWPDRIPVTEAEVDVFERYFGDILDRLFDPTTAAPETKALHELTSDVNYWP